MKKAKKKKIVDKRRKNLEFAIRDKILFKVTPVRSVLQFGKKGKLNPRYISPFDILKQVGNVA